MEHLPLILSTLALLVALVTYVIFHIANKKRKEDIYGIEQSLGDIRKQLRNHKTHQSSENKLRERLDTLERNAERTGNVAEKLDRIADNVNRLMNWAEGADSLIRQMNPSESTPRYPWQRVASQGGAPRSHHDPPPSVPAETWGANAQEAALPGPQGEVVAAYNDASSGGSRGAFMERYPCDRLDVANAREVARDPSTEPEFMAANSGDYLMLKEALHSNQYAVVPRFGLSYSGDHHTRSAMMHVFRSEGVEDGLRYENFRLVAPALFRKRSDGSYELDQPGELELGLGK